MSKQARDAFESMVDKTIIHTPDSSKEPLKVIAGTPDKPLVISGIEIQAYVLEDETRVLSQGGFVRAIGRTGGPTKGHDRVFKLPTFLAPKNINPFVSNDLIKSSQPVVFKPATGGREAVGYRASLLPQVCEVYLKARDAGALLSSQMHIADRAEVLVRGLAQVGIIALVDEATGYQRIREERALATILEKFIAKEVQPWTRTFPFEFYREIFRLKGWDGPDGVKRPSVIGRYTNDIVYKRLAPGVLDELKHKNPVLQSGHRRHRHHQWFTPKLGHPKLKEHLAGVMALMRISTSWESFKNKLDAAFPERGTTGKIHFDDSGEG